MTAGDSSPQQTDSDWVCYCFRVTEREIELAIQALGLTTVAGLSQATAACTGCQTCRDDLEQILSRCAAGSPRFRFSAEELEQYRKAKGDRVNFRPMFPRLAARGTAEP